MINTLYSCTNYISTASSHAFCWIRDNKKLLTLISSIAIAIFSIGAAVSINRFNPKLAVLFILMPGCSLLCALHALGLPRQTQHSHQWDDSSDYSPCNFSFDRDSSFDSSNDKWVDFDD
jgi:hypothetical protein